MLQSGSGLLDPVLENTLSKHKRGGATVKVKQIGAKMAPCLRGWIRVLWTQLLHPVCSKVLQYDSGSEFYELSYWILVLVSKCLNIKQDRKLGPNKVFFNLLWTFELAWLYLPWLLGYFWIKVLIVVIQPKEPRAAN